MLPTLVLVTSEEVSAFLSKNAWRYLDALRVIKNLFREFRLSDEGRNVIYSMYSRGDRQRGGDEFKDVWQIKEKVNAIRPTDSDFPIQDVYDIIALTVACVYPTDIDAVSEFISKHKDSLRVVRRIERKEEGYVAVHFIMELKDRKYAGIRCELQVKTILHDAWSVKTHDLTYKPKGSLPPSIRRHMEHISRQLTTLDEQSEDFKKEVDKLWDWERKRKRACKLAVLKAVATYPPSDSSRRAQYEEIVRDLCENEAAYREGDASEVLGKIESFGRAKHDQYSSKLVTLLAAMRARRDLDHEALDFIDRWIQRSTTPEEKTFALIFKGLAFYCFGELASAVEATERVVELAEVSRLPIVITSKANLAYYLAELPVHPSRVAALKRRALTLVGEIVETMKGAENLPPVEKDSVGFVYVVFGESGEEVRKGLQLCQQMLDSDPGNEVFRAFFELHEDIAKRKLESLDRQGG